MTCPRDWPRTRRSKSAFSYLENGRLSVRVKVAGTDKLLRHEIMRDNSLTREQLNGWRKYVSGLPPLAEVVRDGTTS